MAKALILVDLQNDFLPGGALAVPHGDEVIPVANRLMDEPYDHIIATKDWHPADHISFDQWPAHCVQDTHGAAFPPTLRLDPIDKIIHKGADPKIESYSAFFDNDKQTATGLHQYLSVLHISTLHIMGLATDYCVKYTVLDACALGYNVMVIREGCRAIDPKTKAWAEMEAAGAKII